MFKLLEPPSEYVSIVVSGRRLKVAAQANLASVLLNIGLPLVRTTPVSGAPRLPFCMMGACFDCLATIDGVPNRQTCLEIVSEGMVVEVQNGKAQLGYDVVPGGLE